jgi:hypothetical protein
MLEDAETESFLSTREQIELENRFQFNKLLKIRNPKNGLIKYVDVKETCKTNYNFDIMLYNKIFDFYKNIGWEIEILNKRG